MFDYTEYFKLEAKCLFKDFHKNVKEAVSLSQANTSMGMHKKILSQIEGNKVNRI